MKEALLDIDGLSVFVLDGVPPEDNVDDDDAVLLNRVVAVVSACGDT